jgi:uncharacterized membrane protein
VLVVLLLLVIEARRYRFFDVYRSRVRRVERNFARFSTPPTDGRQMGQSLARISGRHYSQSAFERQCRVVYAANCWIFYSVVGVGGQGRLDCRDPQAGVNLNTFGRPLPTPPSARCQAG